MKKFRGRLFNRAYILKNYISLVSFLINMKPSQLSPTDPSAPVSIYLRFCFSGLTFSFVFFFKDFFYMDQFFKSLYWVCYDIASVLCFGFLAVRRVDLSSLTKDHTHTLCIRRQSLNNWTTEVLTLNAYRRTQVWWFSENEKVKFPNMTNFLYPFRQPAVSRRV